MRKLLLALSVLAALPLFAQPTADIFAKRTYSITRIAKPVVVDGTIGADEWAQVQPIEMAWETFPANNQPSPVKTIAFLGYDDNNLYAAFRAYDPNPAAIRAQLTDRDNAFQDDFIGIVLDTFNDERRAFEFFVNPLGVQMDLTNNDVGGDEDASWDAIWQSAGKIHEDRYEVEIAIPFNQLRFRAAPEQTWGLDMVRIYPRSSRHRIGLHPQNKDRNCYICQSSKLTGFVGITPGRNLELSPTVTSQRTDASTTDDLTSPVTGGSFDTEPGVTARWGITPNLTLNGAINPDFSQVEADSPQLDVNNTFALFFNEKRPFFLEGADFFATPFNVVYTRTVASPDWGAKLTGKGGPNAGGVFLARDAQTQLLIPGSQGSDLTTLPGENLAGVLRYRYDIGKNSTVGLLMTNRSGDDYSNRVGGADVFWRINQRDRISGQLLTSRTEYPDDVATDFEQPHGSFGGEALRLNYTHNHRTGDREWYWNARVEDVGTEFRADSGFMPRVDYRTSLAGLQRTWWAPKDAKRWWTRWWWGGDWDKTDENSTGQELEEEWESWFGFSGPMQSYVEFDLGTRDRFFERLHSNGEKFVNVYAEASPGKRVFASLNVNAGDTIDFANVQLADRVRVNPSIRYKANKHLTLSLGHTNERLNVAGGRLFDANLSELRAVYQFNVRMFVRAILQYTDIKRNVALYDVPADHDARERELFPQLLFSYKLNPQTVLFVGYSSNRQQDDSVDRLTEQDRTFFVKIGYAWSM